MFTSDINKQPCEKVLPKGIRKTVLVYLILSVAAIAVDNIYALFGHGVRSASMSLMFLYPLLGGAMIYFLLDLTAPGIVEARSYRLGYNLYNSGIATLTTGSFFKGILDIAGTASGYTKVFAIFGWSFAATGLIILIVASIRMRTNRYSTTAYTAKSWLIDEKRSAE